MIEHRTAAEFEEVPGIGWRLARELVAAQPIHGKGQLYDIDWIGWDRAKAAWDHFCN